MQFDKANTTMPASFANPAVTSPSIDVSNNRLSTSAYAYNYDAAGNTTRDAQDRKFTYDGEKKQVKVESLTPNPPTAAAVCRDQDAISRS